MHPPEAVSAANRWPGKTARGGSKANALQRSASAAPAPTSAISTCAGSAFSASAAPMRPTDGVTASTSMRPEIAAVTIRPALPNGRRGIVRQAALLAKLREPAAPGDLEFGQQQCAFAQRGDWVDGAQKLQMVGQANNARLQQHAQTCALGAAAGSSSFILDLSALFQAVVWRLASTSIERLTASAKAPCRRGRTLVAGRFFGWKQRRWVPDRRAGGSAILPARQHCQNFSHRRCERWLIGPIC
jgi:hypothetical protein